MCGGIKYVNVCRWGGGRDLTAVRRQSLPFSSIVRVCMRFFSKDVAAGEGRALWLEEEKGKSHLFDVAILYALVKGIKRI